MRLIAVEWVPGESFSSEVTLGQTLREGESEHKGKEVT